MNDFSIADELLKLKQLKDAEVLTEEEFAIHKQAILAGYQAGEQPQPSPETNPTPQQQPVQVIVTTPSPESAKKEESSSGGGCLGTIVLGILLWVGYLFLCRIGACTPIGLIDLWA